MGPKRSSPLDDPPSASSSSSTSSSGAESEEINDREEQEQVQNKGVAESEEEESGDDEEEEEEVENKTPPPVQTPTPTATPQPQSSSGSEGSDSEEDSGGTQTSPTASDFAVKPISSKPMDDSSTKHKKPALKSTKSGAKRPAESEEKRKESQRKKKRKAAASGDEKDGVVEEKKSAINRWSEDDEIVVLKGMIDLQKKKGPISHADMGAFLDFIKKSLHVDVSKNQLVEKVRRLKRKYWGGAVKGEEPVFSKAHDIKCLELAKKIWGGGGGSSNAFVEGVKSNSRKARKSLKISNSPKEEEQQHALQKGLNGEVKEGLNGELKDMKVGEEDFCSMYPHLQESLGSERDENFLSDAGKNLIMGSMSLIGSVKAKELEEKWKKFREDEVALYLQQIELIQEEAKLVLEAMKSSNS